MIKLLPLDLLGASHRIPGNKNAVYHLPISALVQERFKGAASQSNSLKNFAYIKFFNFVICNPCQFSLFLTILVPYGVFIISLVFSYLSN